MRLAVEIGIELDGLMVRRPADSVLNVSHVSVRGIFYVGDPGSPHHPCNRRKRFGASGRGRGLRLGESPSRENSQPEKQCEGRKSLSSHVGSPPKSGGLWKSVR